MPRKSKKKSQRKNPAQVKAPAPVSAGMLDVIKNIHQRVKALEPIVVDQKDVKAPLLADKYAAKMKRYIGVGSIHKKPLNIKVTIIAQVLSGPTAANTALNAVHTLTPGSSGEFASFAALFDDWRTTHVEVHHAVGFTVQSTGANSVVNNKLCTYAWAYDPVDNTALASTGDAMDYDARMAPMLAGYDGVNTPGDFNKTGFHQLRVKIPAPVVDPGILSDLLDSNWVSVKDTAVIVGYGKVWVDPAGAATSSSAVTYYRFTCEFRSRH